MLYNTILIIFLTLHGLLMVDAAPLRLFDPTAAGLGSGATRSAKRNFLTGNGTKGALTKTGALLTAITALAGIGTVVNLAIEHGFKKGEERVVIKRPVPGRK
ncbi:hypothetical protein FRB94_009593 [Tulasnella sp. JGI-2019a]|nr:hypothetical protein FRB93_012648 [Tulasnella sp. JGI-2019a]KAG9010891.1 hypothetical protein FRB94_009593 [Tulasnella sp. JGI-2019a]